MLYANNKWTKQPFPAPAAFAGGGLALMVLVAAWLYLTETPDRIRQPMSAMTQNLTVQAGAAAPSIAQSKPLRPVYRNSVIPGGVHSAAELAFALQNDPVASAHYAGFDVSAAHLVLVEQSRLVHVSYRVGDKIYWTRNKVRLAVGESLLSDGTHLVRARCGNRIADEPEGPMLDQEPAPEVLDALMVSAEDLIDQSANPAAVSNAVFQAPTTAARVEQPPAVRLAATMQSVTPPPFLGLFNPSSQRPLTLLPPTVSVNTPGAAPSEAADVPGSVIPATPAAELATPPSPATPLADVPVADTPAQFPLGPAIGPEPLTPAAAPPAPTPVPEPGSAALAAVALGVLALVRRRARRRPAPQAC